MHSLKFLVVVFLSALFVSGCFVNLLPATTVTPMSDTFVQGVNEFGIRLLRAIWQREGGNVFLSPVSIELCLGMIASGARGETRKEMYETMELSPLESEEVDENNRSLVQLLDVSDPKVTLHTANSLWAREGLPFYEEYLETVRKFYRAEARTVDFTSPDTIPLINHWVEEKTQGAIRNILDRLPEDAILVLLNAIYFKGKWKVAFDPAHTQNLPFFLPGGTQKDLPTMWQEGSFLYLETDALQAVKLPYAGKSFSMYIFLPKRQDGLEALISGLSASTLTGWIASMAERKGQIYLPRFRITFEEVLNDELAFLGMRQAFDPGRADFSGMLPVSPTANAYLSEVKHKSFLEVNEEGTTAAGVTSGIIGLTAMPPEERFIMRVDHPFLLCMRDERNGVLLFAGAVENPEN